HDLHSFPTRRSSDLIMAGIKNSFTYTFEGESNLLRLNELNQGGILISAHLGNWEIAGFLLKRINMSINIVMFEEEHEKIKEYLGDRKSTRLNSSHVK